MAFTNFGYFNQSSGGAPTLSGTAGDLYTLIHYALTTISNWTRTFNTGTPSFNAVWQPAAGGATPVLTCKDNAAVSGDARLAVIRMAESASAVTTYTDPFPTVAQIADGSANWMKSTAASATTRDYHCVVWETGIALAVKVGGTIDQWEMYFAGKCFQRLSGVQDPYPWMCWSRNSAIFTTVILASQGSNNTITNGASKVFMMRNAAGAIKSEQGVCDGHGGSIGNAASTAGAGGGYLTSIDKAKLCMHAIGSSTTAFGAAPLIDRLCIPQIYQCVHSSYSGVTETDNVNDGSNTAVILRSSSTNALWLLTSNTFSGFPAG